MPKPNNKNTTPLQDFHIDWKSLFSPCPVDIEAQTPELVKFARRYNMFFWCIWMKKKREVRGDHRHHQGGKVGHSDQPFSYGLDFHV